MRFFQLYTFILGVVCSKKIKKSNLSNLAHAILGKAKKSKLEPGTVNQDELGASKDGAAPKDGTAPKDAVEGMAAHDPHKYVFRLNSDFRIYRNRDVTSNFQLQ